MQESSEGIDKKLKELKNGVFKVHFWSSVWDYNLGFIRLSIKT